jgi:glycolate oxidase iron-sulfur subunit
MAQAVEKCVHCGFCLATCPTYTVLGEEMDSPRGRIVLMKSVLEGSLDLEQALPYIDRCLGCLACVTACPSGVSYGELLVPFRLYAEENRKRPPMEKAARQMALDTLPYPRRFRLAASAGNLAKPLKPLLPEQLQAMLALLPDALPPGRPLPSVFPAQGKQRARVALLSGCVQQALDPEINWATLRVLALNGVEVVIPESQGCCGALALHSGARQQAMSLARRTLEAFPKDVDAILTNAAGCGSGMQEYPLLFKGSEWEKQASQFAGRVLDISVFLDQLGILDPPPLPERLQVVYHDACHLAHAQRVVAEPRRLLERIPNLHILPVAEPEICCGSAGIYNIEEPETGRALGMRKAANILNTEAQAVVTGNIGCLIQLRTSLENAGSPRPVWHTIEMLDRAYRGWG